MATFGDTNIRTIEYTQPNRLIGILATCPDKKGIANSIYVYISSVIPYAGPGPAKCALYRQSDSSLVGVTEEKTLGELTAQWIAFNFTPSKPSISNIAYIPVIWFGGAYTHSVYYNTVSGATWEYQDVTYNSFPNPASFNILADTSFSIYVDYTPLKGVASTPIGNLMQEAGIMIRKRFPEAKPFSLKFPQLKPLTV